MLPPNPIKVLRTQLGYSINQLEYQSGIHRQVIIRAEQGCYAHIPPRLYNYLISRLGDTTPSLADNYRTWITEKRRSSLGKLSLQLPTFVSYRHPFTHWRQEAELSRAGLCTHYCINLSTVARFERQYMQQASVPKQIIEALQESGYSSETIHDLESQYELYRNYQLAVNLGNELRQDSCRKEIELYMNRGEVA